MTNHKTMSRPEVADNYVGLTREAIEELFERSKDDRAIIVGSEVRQLAAMAMRLCRVEHLAWHLCESSEENAQTGAITVERDDFDALAAVLPESHPHG